MIADLDAIGDRARLWMTAETAVRCADPFLIDQATETLESTLRSERMLDQQPVSLRRASALHVH
jgi:hypothetical protein